ncbi:hypothetical protein D3C80_1112050 [compost metagenome]
MLTWSAIEARLPLMLLFCSLSWLAMVLKRLLSDCALVSSNWREASSLGLADALCMAVKKLCNAAVMPVSAPESRLSIGAT